MAGPPEDGVVLGALALGLAEPEPPVVGWPPEADELVPECFVPVPTAAGPGFEPVALDWAAKLWLLDRAPTDPATDPAVDRAADVAPAPVPAPPAPLVVT